MEQKPLAPLIGILRVLAGPLLIIIIAIAFFFAYNTYLIDHSLESLKFSLNKVSSAQTIEDAKNLKIVLGEVLVKEMSAEKLNTSNVVNLEFSQNIISEGKVNDQLKDLKLILSNVVKEKEAQRAPILRKLDDLNAKVKSGMDSIYSRFHKVAKRRAVDVGDLSLLDKAKDFESKWQMEEAVSSYDAFIEKYPDYKDIGWVRLRLAYDCLKMGDLKRAESIFSSLSKEYFGEEEAQVAQRFTIKIKEIKKSSAEKESLINKAISTKTDEEKQRMYYRLGVIDTYNYNLGSAREFFKKVVELNPASILAQKSQFNIGWSLKFQNDLEKSALVFEDVIKVYAKGDIVLNAKYQLADTYHKSGKYEEAIAIYKKIAQDYKDKPIAPLAQFQAGYSYLYNLNDPVQASDAFNTLNSEFKSSVLAKYAEMDLTPTLETRFRDFAFSLLLDGKYDKSREAFMKAIEVNKNDAWSHSGLGNSLALSGALKEGMSETEIGASLLSDSFTHAALGFNLEMEGKINEAMEEYKKSIAIDKEYLVAHYNLGRLYSIQARYDEAIIEFKETIRIDPKFPQGHGNLAHAYWFKGEPIMAMEEYSKALELAPNYLEAHYNLGLIFKALGRKEEARREFGEALRIVPAFQEAKDSLENL